MDAAVEAIAPGVHAGSTIIFETTLPVGDTRSRFAPRLEAVSGLRLDRDFFVAFSPERLYSGSALKNLAMYPSWSAAWARNRAPGRRPSTARSSTRRSS